MKEPTYLWRKFVAPHWIDINEANLRDWVGDEFAVITRPDRERALLEAACKSQKQARKLVKEFGGRLEKLSRDWLKRFTRAQKTASLKIGRRLIIFNVGGTSASRVRAGRAESRRQGRSHILRIPASMAFGTGEHATTAMSLRLLEQVTRGWKPGWAMVDLGTGSGILALAAKRFGARRVLAIDKDPTAISTAKTNARLNKIDNIDFRVCDARSWKIPHKSRLRGTGYGDQVDIVTANLFNELLIEILPKLKRSRWLILSGVLRKQETDLLRALRQNKIDIVKARRRGKWIAIAAALS